MTNNIGKSALLALQIIFLIAPFALTAYHIYSFVNYGDVNLIPLSTAFSDYLNIAITADQVPESLETINDFYVFIVRLPLLLWFFILSIPAFVGIYRKID